MKPRNKMRQLDLIPQYWGKLVLGLETPKILVGAVLAVGEFVFGRAYDYHFVTVVAVLICLDTISGMMAAAVENKWHGSVGIWRTGVKLTAYAIALAATQLAFSSPLLVPGRGAVVALLLALIALTELVSIIENLRRAGFTYPPAMERVVYRFRDWLESRADSLQGETSNEKTSDV